MRRLPVIISLLAGGAWLLPLPAYGHGMELMEARLRLDTPGEVGLEITADYGGNLMLNGEEDARAALQDILRIESSGQEYKLADLAPLRLERRDHFDSTSPMPVPNEAPGTKHELVTALWSWRPTSETVRFTVPQGCIHDVLFWKHDPKAPPRWNVLISGDYSPEIHVPRASFSPSMMGLGILGVLLLAAIGFRFFLRPQTPSPAPTSHPASVPP